MKNKILLIILVILLGLLLRSYEFGKIPAGIYVDEAAQGYNAYSILTTGKDEYGKAYPVFLRSFGTYASSLYSYLTVIPVSLIGLTEVSVRLVSLISGITIVSLVVLQFGLLVGLVVAITPVFIFVSRAAFESNLGLAILIAGSVLALRAEKTPRLLLLAFPLLTFSSYGYHAERFLSIILVTFFSIKYWKKIEKKLIIISSLLGLVVIIPILTLSFTQGAYARLSGLEVEGTILEKVVSYARLYLAYLSPSNLFSKPDPDPQRSFADLSAFYWWMFIPFIFGIYKFVKQKKWQETTGQYFLILVFFSPILAAFTKDYFSTIRVLPLFLAVAWLIALGLRTLVKYKFIYVILILVSVLELYSNLTLLKYQKSSIWNYEYKALFNSLNEYKDHEILIENSNGKPVYILEAFFNKTNPQILQNRFSPEQLENYYAQTQFNPNFKLSNIEYRPLIWEEDVYKDQMIVASPLSISTDQAKEHKLTLMDEINNASGEVVLKTYKTDPKEKCQSFDFLNLDIKKRCQNIAK